jgi:hypothetical protein
VAEIKYTISIEEGITIAEKKGIAKKPEMPTAKNA